MRDYISSILERLGKMSMIENLNFKLYLRKNNYTFFIKIEVNSLSLNQVKDVINGQLVLGERKEIQDIYCL